MHILVTGSSGTIGTRLCERLLAEGHDVIGVDWKPNAWVSAVEAVTRHCDLRDERALAGAKLPDSIDAIVHLAANARVYELVTHPDRARDNVLMLFNVLEFARTRVVPRFLFASSREVYGNENHREMFSEDVVAINHCESPYTASKLSGEAFVEAYRRCYGLDHVTLRFSNVYGMYDDSERVIPLFFRLARTGKPLIVYGEEKCLDFTYIDDTIAGILLTLETFDTTKNESYNIAFGQGIRLVDLAKTMVRLLDSASKVVLGNPRTGEIIRFTADITKARTRLRYTPQVPFDEGIARTVKWYKAHM